MQPYDRVANSPHHDHLVTVGIGNQVFFPGAERFFDTGRGDRITTVSDPDIHAVDNGQCQGDFDDDGGSHALHAVNRHRASHLFNIADHDIHAHTAARKLGDLFIGGKAGDENQIEYLLIGHLRRVFFDQAVFPCLFENLIPV
ncbi:hypothetical protein SDC9_165775 [bioreactor metagenome]|uniref:Uncharacterized protein n=1 Tax=bioreactor metagenome TaxID=1076179 RepID=A0A645FVB4_9ZZZZ